MVCAHIDEYISELQPPRASQQVHKEECTQCFDGQDDESGVCVCLHCFNGGCLGDDRAHSKQHFQKSGHALGLIVKRSRKPVKVRDDQEPPMKKLAIQVPSDEELYDYAASFKCFRCPEGDSQSREDPRLEAIKDGIMKHMASSQQSEVKAWEEQLEACEHTLLLNQEDVGAAFQVSPHCKHCDLTANLWLCLTCGDVNCGRQQFGGIGGNGHALEHFKATGHGVGIKLGTITPEGGGDIYCYSCDDSRIDMDLPNHLKHFGLDIVSQQKTDKSMTELQIEHNLKFDFSMTGDDGKDLEPVFGPGLTGLKNLGNSCYMASVLQGIFSLPAFRRRYDAKQSHSEICPVLLSADCLECQMLKISDGLLSGRYSRPAAATQHEDASKRFQEGIKPNMFKALVGKGHEEFSTMRQQDSEEFLQHLIQRLREEATKRDFKQEDEATEVFRFGMEQKLVCGECQGVRLKVDSVDSISVPMPVKEIESLVAVGAGDAGSAAPTKQYEAVDLTTCLRMAVESETLDWTCPKCKKGVKALKSSGFKTYPEVLVIHMQKFQMVNWVPAKLDIPVNVDDQLRLDDYTSSGKQDGEVEIEEEEASNEPVYNEVVLGQLTEMGFPKIRAQKALLANPTADADSAMMWLIDHGEDADIDQPIAAVKPSTPNEGFVASPAAIENIVAMGIPEAQARKALRETGNDTERAVEWIFSHPEDTGEDIEMAAPTTSAKQTGYGGSASLPAQYRLKAFVSHKGPSVHSGHYVATIKQDDGNWVLFNDEKVVKAEGESNEKMKGLAYLYIYERVNL